MKTSYHVHSIYSDGESDIKALVEGANALGLEELGISDHYVVTPDSSPVWWSMPIDSLSSYLADIEEASAYAAPGLTVLKGLEADFFPESINRLQEIVAGYQLDYVIGSIHFVDGFPVDENAENWEKHTEKEKNDIIRGYWARIKGMAQCGIFSFAGHLDLYKKFGCGPTIDISNDINEALDAIAISGMAVEINTSGWHTPAKEAYPSPDILKECVKRNIPLVVNADAHVPENLMRSYDQAEVLLNKIGYNPKKLWKPAR